MTHTSLVLQNWKGWPDHINVCKDGVIGSCRRYVPAKTCLIVYDPVHQDYYCSACGEYFDTGMYVARDSDDWLEHKDFRFCPNCGAKVVDE